MLPKLWLGKIFWFDANFNCNTGRKIRTDWRSLIFTGTAGTKIPTGENFKEGIGGQKLLRLKMHHFMLQRPNGFIKVDIFQKLRPEMSKKQTPHKLNATCIWTIMVHEIEYLSILYSIYQHIHRKRLSSRSDNLTYFSDLIFRKPRLWNSTANLSSPSPLEID